MPSPLVVANDELHRRLALANAIASGELEGVEYTPAMRELLERASRGEVSDSAFRREALALAREMGSGSIIGMPRAVMTLVATPPPFPGSLPTPMIPSNGWPTRVAWVS